jgi:hypothetical protein
LRPADPKIACTLPFYLNQKGDTTEAIAMLKATVEKHFGYQGAQMLLLEIASTAPRP